MIIGKNNLIEFIRTNQTPYWYLRRSEKSEPIFTCDDDTDKTVEESINRLNQVLGLLGPGNYFIEAWNKKGQTKMRAKDSFAFNDNFIGSLANNQPATPNVDIQTEISKALSEYKKEQRIEQLEKELNEEKKKNKELESSTEASIGRIVSRLNDTALGGIIAAFLPNYKPADAISGITQENLSPEELTKRLEAAFEKWSKTENDPVTLIEKIAELATTDADTYRMAKNILIKK
jgi:hypothetical protein